MKTADVTKIMDAARAEAEKVGKGVTIVVLNGGGIPLALERFQDPGTFTSVVADGKANASVAMGRDSSQLAGMVERAPAIVNAMITRTGGRFVAVAWRRAHPGRRSLGRGRRVRRDRRRGRANREGGGRRARRVGKPPNWSAATPGSRGPVTIETPRLLLRAFEAYDADDVYAYSCDERFTRYLPSIPVPYEYSQAEQFVADSMATDWAVEPLWAIVHEGRVVGSIFAHIDTFAPRAEIGYSMAPGLWNQGFMTEAARAVLHWLFTQTDVVRVMATADERNIGSWRVMEHLGMQHEGTLRMHRNDRGTPADQVVYGLLRSEWEATR
jgi:[ribosomal protein S5]-alanine N-acetyltransferase